MQQRKRGRQRQQISASAHISRDQIEDLVKPEYLLIPVQKEDRVLLTIDASSLNDEELDQLRKNDPFMYYSIPSIRNASLRGSLQGSVGSGSGDRRLHHLRQSAPAALMSSTAASVAAETIVQRKSCISFEVSFEEAISDLIESIGGGGEFDAGNEDESFDDILDQIINSDDLSFRRSLE